ncbi:MAG: VWA domain-containing protein [Ktedonobacteraceae bacterium]
MPPTEPTRPTELVQPSLSPRLPLFDLFTSLRQAELPLGIDEYKLLLAALEGGYGGPDLDSLANLCKTLWVKSDEDEHIFDRCFQQIMDRVKKSAADALTASPPVQEARPSSGPLSGKSSQTGSTLENAPSAEQQAVQAVLQISRLDELPRKRFVRSDEYFPVTRRQMKQGWRHLRRPVREGAPVELDVERTVEDIGRQGLLFEPVVLPRYVNRAELLLLLDQGGSMVPFHPLANRLAETALRGGRLNNLGIYYFHNYPVDRLFLSPNYQKDVPIRDIMSKLHYEHSAVLIFSDAGAARGRPGERRYKMTKSFLDEIAQYVHYRAWLNPMPIDRWSNTTAERIAQLVPMFDVSRRGLENAINVLRGLYMP